MKFGIDRLRDEPALRKPLAGKRVALLAHPASVTRDLVHSLDALALLKDIKLTAAFGPQHGLRGDKQDNMVESADFHDPAHGIPVFSLYGEVRRPTATMMDSFDVLLVDLQDVGCRVYTFITTLRYVLEAAAQHKRLSGFWTGRTLLGVRSKGFDFALAGKVSSAPGQLPMRHGLTLGELAKWFVQYAEARCANAKSSRWKVGIRTNPPGFGWPLGERSWINPSPNAANLSMARCYAGTVMLEGTTLSEGRGTTRPLELFGAPDLESGALLSKMEALAPEWLRGCRLRECWFEPTFHKHAGKLCAGIQIHVDDPGYDHENFRPWRLIALALKSLRALRPDYALWRNFAYEYERDRLAIDLINGGEVLRQWVDDPAAVPVDLDKMTTSDEKSWIEERESVLLYR